MKHEKLLYIVAAAAACVLVLLIVGAGVGATIYRRRRRRAILDKANFTDSLVYDALTEASQNACDLRNKCASFLPS